MEHEYKGHEKVVPSKDKEDLHGAKTPEGNTPKETKTETGRA